MVVCRNEAKMFGKMVPMIAMVALPCDNVHILPKKHSGTRAIFNFLEQSTIAIFTERFYLWGTFFK